MNANECSFRSSAFCGLSNECANRCWLEQVLDTVASGYARGSAQRRGREGALGRARKTSNGQGLAHEPIRKIVDTGK